MQKTKKIEKKVLKTNQIFKSNNGDHITFYSKDVVVIEEPVKAGKKTITPPAEIQKLIFIFFKLFSEFTKKGK